LWQSKNEKNGIISGKQFYKCHSCHRQFLDTICINLEELWHLYSSGKQTYYQLSSLYGCFPRTIQRWLDKAVIVNRTEFSDVAVVLMDTTYFGRNFSVMVFKNALNGVCFVQKICLLRKKRLAFIWHNRNSP